MIISTSRIGSVVAPQPDGRYQDQPAQHVGEARGEIGRDHPTERHPDDRGALEPERAERLLVGEQQLPERVNLTDCLRVAGRRVRRSGA